MDLSHKIIIGLVGQMASGKDAVAAYLKEKYAARTVSFSQPLRDILDRLLLPQTRENMAELGNSLRQIFGVDTLNRVIVHDIERNEGALFCVPNIRLEGDMIGIKDLPGFFLIHVHADPKIRYERLTQRGQNSDDATKTWEEFLEDHKRSTEVTIDAIAARADFTITNENGFDALYAQVEEVMTQIQKRVDARHV